jgi:hypothetical protein
MPMLTYAAEELPVRVTSDTCDMPVALHVCCHLQRNALGSILEERSTHLTLIEEQAGLIRVAAFSEGDVSDDISTARRRLFDNPARNFFAREFPRTASIATFQVC